MSEYGTGGARSLPGEDREGVDREPVCPVCGVRLGGTHSEACTDSGEVTVRDLLADRVSGAPVRVEVFDGLPEQVHIAGADLRVGEVVRQRCAWCGAVILEYDTSRLGFAVGDDEEPPSGPMMFGAGALVLISGTWPVMKAEIQPTVHADDVGDERAFVIPQNSCMALDVEVTR